jgi:hypothetical protein
MISLKSISQLIFVIVKCSVLFELRTEFLNITSTIFGVNVTLGVLVVSVLAFGFEVRGFKPG